MELRQLINTTVQIKTAEPNPILLNQLSNIFVMSKAWATNENFSTLLHKIGMHHKKLMHQLMQWEQVLLK